MTTQTTPFATALDAWMKRERLTAGRAARYLGVKCSEIDEWKDGTREPSKGEICRVLERIAAGGR